MAHIGGPIYPVPGPAVNLRRRPHRLYVPLPIIPETSEDVRPVETGNSTPRVLLPLQPADMPSSTPSRYRSSNLGPRFPGQGWGPSDSGPSSNSIGKRPDTSHAVSPGPSHHDPRVPWQSGVCNSHMIGPNSHGRRPNTSPAAVDPRTVDANMMLRAPNLSNKPIPCSSCQQAPGRYMSGPTVAGPSS